MRRIHIRAGNVEALAEAIEQLIRNKQEGLIRGQKARDRVLNEFSVDRMSVLYTEQYERAILNFSRGKSTSFPR